MQYKLTLNFIRLTTALDLYLTTDMINLLQKDSISHLNKYCSL